MDGAANPDQPWYSDRRFDQYWQHYNHTFAWYQKHKQVMIQQQQQGHYKSHAEWMQYSQQLLHRSPPPLNTMWPTQSSYTSYPSARGTRPRTTDAASSVYVTPKRGRRNKRPTSRQGSHEKKRQHRSSINESPMEEDYESNNESIHCEMDFSEDMLAFLAESAKHRRQRDKAKKLADKKAKEEEHRTDFDVSYVATSKAPKERPGIRRTTEMKLLYGKGAAMIHGMETAMQLTFDRNCDLYQPKAWPNLPLKIQFE